MASNQPHCLLLMRHAKSDWSDDSLDDRDRPLATRGATAAEAMGRHMAKSGLIPDLILCSPARRAQETYRFVSKPLPSGIDMKTVAELYDFGDGSAVQEVICRSGGNAMALMLIGHNPAFERLALRLSAEDSQGQRARMAHKFPTAAMAVIEFELDEWRHLKGPGRLKLFVRPRDIAGNTGN
jgi:phosphohistidine phosphatase